MCSLSSNYHHLGNIYDVFVILKLELQIFVNIWRNVSSVLYAIYLACSSLLQHCVTLRLFLEIMKRSLHDFKRIRDKKMSVVVSENLYDSYLAQPDQSSVSVHLRNYERHNCSVLHHLSSHRWSQVVVRHSSDEVLVMSRRLCYGCCDATTLKGMVHLTRDILKGLNDQESQKDWTPN